MNPYRIVLLGAALLVAAGTAVAQSYPDKPIRVVVPYAPGGSTDLLARLLGQRMTESMGQQIVIDNRPGAGGTLGSEHVARAAPDGYTILLGTGASHGLNSLFMKSIPYDPVKDFTPIIAAVDVPIGLAVHPSVPVSTASELVAYAKKNPGKLAYGSSGTGTPHQLAGELLKQMTGIDIVHVPYKGGGPAVQDLVGGQIPIAFLTLSTALPHLKTGKLRILGMIESTRARSAPEIPPVGDSIPGYVIPSSWLGFFGPANLPAPILARLHAELEKALKHPEVSAKLEASGQQVVASSQAAFKEMVVRDLEAYRKIVGAAGIRAE